MSRTLPPLLPCRIRDAGVGDWRRWFKFVLSILLLPVGGDNYLA